MRRPACRTPVAEALRQSFMATMKDPAFLAEAQRRGLDIDPTPGEEIDALVLRLYETSPPIALRVREILQGK